MHLKTRLGGRHRARRERDSLSELFQTGCLALVLAATRYDPKRDGEFPAYALPRIRRAIHAALLAGNSLVRVPYGAACRGYRAQGVVSGRAHFHLPGEEAAHTTTGTPDRDGNEDESIRHALRRRFERAARRATEKLSLARWRRSDAPAILARVTAERVLVSDPGGRTPVRRLASELRISSGQVTGYEQRVLAVTREQLRDDPAAHLLVEFAREDPAGFDGVVHADRRRRLLQAEVSQFESRFAGLDRSGQARVLYGLVQRSSAGVVEVARNLFLMTGADS